MPHQWKVTEYDSDFPAILSIVSGLIYFLRKRTLITLAVLMFLLVGPFYVAWQYFTKEQVAIQTLRPLEPKKDSGFNFNLIDRAYAFQKPGGVPIVIKGAVYGYSDPSFQIWKVYGQPTIIVYDSTTGAMFSAEIPLLGDRERMKQLK